MKKITHLLSMRGIECTEDEPLHSRFGKHWKALIAERDLHEFTDYNDLRNNRSLEHNN